MWRCGALRALSAALSVCKQTRAGTFPSSTYLHWPAALAMGSKAGKKAVSRVHITAGPGYIHLNIKRIDVKAASMLQFT